MSKTEQHEPTWNRLYEVASAQEGLFTTQQAEEAGYSSQLLDYHIRAKRVVRVRRGIYRLVHFPAGQHEELVVAPEKLAGCCIHSDNAFFHKLYILPAPRGLDDPRVTVSDVWHIVVGVQVNTFVLVV